MGPIGRLVRNRDFIILFAIALGLFADGAAAWTRPAVLPALAVVMTLSSLGVSGRMFLSPRTLVAPIVAGLFLSYVVLAGFILAASRLFLDDPALSDGWVIMAAVPPAIAIIPFTEFIDGDREFSLIATMGGYLSGLFVMPAIALVFLGSGLVGPGQLLTVVCQLIILPLAASRVMLRFGWAARVEKVKGAITNWCFFLIVYTIIGLNKPFLLDQPLSLVPLAAVAAASTFGLGFLIERGGRLAGVDPSRLSSLVLLGTLKNSGLAGGLALALFSRRTALPAVVSTLFMIGYIIWLSSRKRRADRAAEGSEP